MIKRHQRKHRLCLHYVSECRCAVTVHPVVASLTATQLIKEQFRLIKRRICLHSPELQWKSLKSRLHSSHASTETCWDAHPAELHRCRGDCSTHTHPHPRPHTHAHPIRLEMGAHTQRHDRSSCSGLQLYIIDAGSGLLATLFLIHPLHWKS